MSELDANIIVDGQKVVATLAQSGTVIKDGGVIDATSVIQTDDGPQKVVKVMDINGGGGGGGGDVPQNTNPLERITCEEDNVTYTTITIDENEMELEAPYFDSLSEAPTTPLHFIGILPAEYAESGTTWEYEIVQYKANEAWYHLIGTDMVFCIQRDAETEDILMVDIVYPLEAMLPDFVQGSYGNKQLIQRDNSDGTIKWVTDKKLENTANQTTGTGIGVSAYTQTGIAIGRYANAPSGLCIGNGYDSTHYPLADSITAIAIGNVPGTGSNYRVEAKAIESIQLGAGVNNTYKQFQVYSYPMLDGNTGKIPMARLPIVQCTQAEYDALVSGGTVDANTIYCIIPA